MNYHAQKVKGNKIKSKDKTGLRCTAIPYSRNYKRNFLGRLGGQAYDLSKVALNTIDQS